MNDKLIIYTLFILLLSGYIIYFVISYLNTKEKSKKQNKNQNKKLNILETFYDDETDELLKESENVGEISGPCKSTTNISEMCKNENCCANNPSNCYCKNKKLKSCRKLYNKCLNDKYYNRDTLNYYNIDKKKACKHILDNCCNYIKKELSNESTNFSKTESLLSLGGIKERNEAKICSMKVKNVNECKNICNDLDDCKTFRFFKKEINMSDCDFYNKYYDTYSNPAYNASEKRYSFYEKNELANNNNNKSNISNESFSNTTTTKNTKTTTNSYKNICKSYANSCNGNKKNCKCSTTIVKNCNEQYKKCLDDPEINFSNKEKYCSKIFGECCAVIDNINISDKFTYSEPTIGFPSNNNLICNISESVLSLNECQKECSLNEECSFIDTNLKYIIENDNKLLTPKCKLYKGTYSNKQSSNELTSNYKNNINNPTIYIKNKVKSDIDKLDNLIDDNK